MKVKILKDHPNGLKEGQVKDLNISIAREVIRLGVAEEVKPKKAPVKKAK